LIRATSSIGLNLLIPPSNFLYHIEKIRKGDKVLEALLAEWGLEILFALISTGVLGWAKWNGDKLKKEKLQAEENARVLAEQ
jgi:hypothetical protein